MTTAETLYQLQEIDKSIKAKEERLAEVEAQLGESEALREARANLEQAQEQLYALEKRQRQQELELQTVTSKIESEEERLYGGRVTNPKELAGLQKEVRYLKEQRTEVEDQLLETMMSREETAGQVEERQTTLDDIESNWEREQTSLATEQDELQEALADLRGRRKELIEQIPPRTLSTYDHLRRTKGLAVAPFKNGMCTGCRVSLSAVDQQRVRSDELVTCSNCGRVLVVLQ